MRTKTVLTCIVAATMAAVCMAQRCADRTMWPKDSTTELAYMQPRLYLETHPCAKDPFGTGFYRFSRPKLVGWGILAIGGFMDGAVEGYEFDGRHSFERKWGKDPYGFWGSESWRMIYNDGDPAKGAKSNFAKWLGAKDFYHTGDDLRKLSYLSGSITLGIGGHRVNSKWWHYLLDAAIGYAVSGFAKSRGMNWVRN